MRILAVILILISLAVPVMADYSSLTPAEKQSLLIALGMSYEYRMLLDGADHSTILEAVRVTGNQWRIRVEISIPRQDDLPRSIIRDVWVEIKPTRSGVSWPWVVAAGAAGILAGIIIAK